MKKFKANIYDFEKVGFVFLREMAILFWEQKYILALRSLVHSPGKVQLLLQSLSTKTEETPADLAMCGYACLFMFAQSYCRCGSSQFVNRCKNGHGPEGYSHGKAEVNHLVCWRAPSETLITSLCMRVTSITKLFIDTEKQSQSKRNLDCLVKLC